MRRFVSSFYGLEYEEFASGFYVYEDYEALRRLFSGRLRLARSS
jgi:hypothetical protein